MQGFIDAQIEAGRGVIEEGVCDLLDVISLRVKLAADVGRYSEVDNEHSRERAFSYYDRTSDRMRELGAERSSLRHALTIQRRVLTSICPHPPVRLSEEQLSRFVRSLPTFFRDHQASGLDTSACPFCVICTGRRVEWAGPWYADLGFVTYVAE